MRKYDTWGCIVENKGLAKMFGPLGKDEFRRLMILVYDTETTGLPRDWNAPISDSDNWPRLVQLAWQLHDENGALLSRGNRIVRPDGFTIPFNSTKIHGITTDRALAEGSPLDEVVAEFMADAARANYVMGHNIGFDVNVVGAELLRLGQSAEPLTGIGIIDSKDEGTEYCAIPGGRGGKFKWPTLTELHQKLFGEGFGDAHDAAYDVAATARCLFEMIRLQVIVRPEFTDPAAVKYEAPKLEAANFVAPQVEEKVESDGGDVDAATEAALAEAPFTHLHVHSQFSVLQAVSSVGELVSAAKDMGMPALAVTDHGNMMAAFQFVRACNKEGIKPIVGAELNVCRDMHDKSVKDDGYPTVFLAKNKNGYHNLAKLASKAYTEGFYYVPRIDRALVEEYKEDLVVLTGGLFGEVPSLILNVGEAQAEEAFVFWKNLMGNDFYVELNRHGLEEEAVVNQVLQGLAATHDVKLVASNNSYYTRQDQSDAHDILLCVKDARNVSQPKRYVGKRGREFRFGFPNDSFYLKSPEEMKALFADVPEAITNISALLDQCESYVLERDVLLPAFDIPEEFVHEEDAKDGGKRGENAYLRHITYEGAKKRYGEISEEVRERLDFELETIERTGYPGYFLIVQDFTTAAREMGVSVGPGRGSAAGSAVAYCVGITNVDPIKYDLLFERFLNPDRVSLPDIDIDFDDEGRGKVIDYVIDKYGANQVAQIITYGTMAAKSSIRDTARVMELPLGDADRLAKLRSGHLPQEDVQPGRQGAEGEGEERRICDGRTAQGHQHPTHARRPNPSNGPRPRRQRAQHRHPCLRGDHHARRHHQLRSGGDRQGQCDGLHAVRQRGGGRCGPAEDGLLGAEDPDGHQGRGQERQAAARTRPRSRCVSARRHQDVRTVPAGRHGRHLPVRIGRHAKAPQGAATDRL